MCLGGRKASGGSHSLADRRGGGDCGGLSTPPRSSGAVEVAPEAAGHLAPPGRVPPYPAASVGASARSRRPPTGAAPLPPLRRRGKRGSDRGRARARPFNGGVRRVPGRPTAWLGPSRGPDVPARRQMRPARDVCTPSVECGLGPRAVPRCKQSTAGRPCAWRTRPRCGVTLVSPLCHSTVAEHDHCRSHVPCVAPGGGPPLLSGQRRASSPPSWTWRGAAFPEWIVPLHRGPWRQPPGLMKNPGGGRRRAQPLAR